MRLRLQQKIQLYILASIIIIYLGAVGFISIRAKNKAIQDAKLNTDLYVREAAFQVKAKMDADMALTRTLAQSFITYKEFEDDSWMKRFSDIFYEVFKRNEQLYSLWDSWELNVIDSAWTEPTGRRATVYWRENGEIKSNVERRSIGGDPELYARIKKMKHDAIWEPYFDVFTEGKAEKKLMTSFSSPIIIEGRYTGIVAIDITLDRFQKMVNNIKPFDGSYAFLVSNTGIIAGHPDEFNFNRNLTDLFPDDTRTHQVLQFVKNGEDISYISKNEEGSERYYSFYPIHVEGTKTPWSIAVVVPTNTIMKDANRNFVIFLIAGLIGLLVIGVVIFLITRSVTKPIQKITYLLNELARGKVDHHMHLTINTGDEIGEMAAALNTSVSGLIEKQDFAKKIGRGELDAGFGLVGNEDTLGMALIEMRDSLVNAKKEEEKRKIEDEKRRWANEGTALFSDILRQNNNNVEILSDEIIKHLVKYTGANQGGLFLYNEDNPDDPCFELVSAFAFDRKKYMIKKIRPGEGLIGACALEKEYIYMTSVPHDYINITSGLGGANPGSLLITPMILEENVLGIIEIASFRKLDQHVIDFVQRVAENVAATLNSVKINQRTNLLLEQTRQQAEEMASQEEEMRQNIEELQATQEEAARKSIEIDGFMNGINRASYVIQYDTNGYIIDINEAYLKLLRLKREDAIGMHHSENIDFTAEQQKNYGKFWKDLKEGQINREKSQVNIKNRNYVFLETYTPILNEDGVVVKIMKIAINVNDF